MSTARIVRIAAVSAALIVGLGAAATAKSKPQRAEPAAAAAPSPQVPAGGAIGSLEIVTAAQIAATAAHDIKAALALVPTLVIDDTGGPAGLTTLSLRGSDARQVLVLVDGHRVARASSSAFNLNDLTVPVERIARIEVMPAPASLIYGPDAIGGVVNIVTLPAGVTPGIAVSYGRGAEAEQRIAGGVQYGFKQLGLRLDGELLSGDGYRDNGDSDQKSFSVGMAVAPAPWGLDARWSSLHREAGVAGPAANPTPGARQKDALDGLRADILYQDGTSLDARIGAFSNSQSLQVTDPAPPVVDPAVTTSPVASSQDNSSSGVEARLDFDTNNGERYSVGGEWVNDRVTGLGDGEHVAEHWSLYLQDQWRSGGWSAVGALRRDEYATYGGRIDPSLSVGWGGGGWKLWAAWAKNFRTPNFEERFLDGQFVKGNPDLEPESANNYDGGIELAGESGRVRLSTFWRSVDNLISWSDADGDFVTRPVNVSRATISGWEAQVLYRPSASIAIPIGYQRLSTRDDETQQSLPGAVRSLLRAVIQGSGTSLTWSLEYAITDRGEYQRRDGAWHYNVLNAALAWRDKLGSVPVQLSLRVENLQDQAYETVEGYPMRGRSWFAEVKVGR